MSDLTVLLIVMASVLMYGTGMGTTYFIIDEYTRVDSFFVVLGSALWPIILPAVYTCGKLRRKAERLAVQQKEDAHLLSEAGL